jgi:DNA-binding NarL/FixJ family response regulator
MLVLKHKPVAFLKNVASDRPPPEAGGFLTAASDPGLDHHFKLVPVRVQTAQGAAGHALKILVIDDHVLIRHALRGVLAQLRRQAITLEASDCAQAMRLLEQNHNVDLILLDLGAPDGGGFSALAALRERCPEIDVVCLAGSSDMREVMRAVELGAVGYIPKSTPCEVILSAIELVFSGGIYIPADALRRDTALAEVAGAATHACPSQFGLTERQIEVLALLRQGKSNKAIARVLGLAEPTVKNHITAILKALKVASRTEAVIAVDRLKLKLPECSAP